MAEEGSSSPKLSMDRVVSLGAGLILFGMTGFYNLPGMIADGADGSKLVNAFYCSVMSLTTFGDICPGETDAVGRVFLTVLPLLGLGFFCGPILELASSWQARVPGGTLGLGVATLLSGVLALTWLEQLSVSEAIHLCVITATTVGYGDLAPSSDAGRLFLALYAIAVCNVMGGFLDSVRDFLESYCAERTSSSSEVTEPAQLPPGKAKVASTKEKDS